MFHSGFQNKKSMKLSWYEQSGKLGGEDGFEIDTVKRMVYPYAKAPEKMSTDNADTVRWVIEKNIKGLEKTISDKEQLLSMKEKKLVKIVGGVKTIAPPNPQQRELIESQLRRWRKQLENIKSIRIEELIS
jgi:hypothetical protein